MIIWTWVLTDIKKKKKACQFFKENNLFVANDKI